VRVVAILPDDLLAFSRLYITIHFVHFLEHNKTMSEELKEMLCELLAELKKITELLEKIETKKSDYGFR
jgi:hypothetical protein